ncbi:MAG: ATP-binding protein, partial [Pseudomonadota bacterium]
MADKAGVTLTATLPDGPLPVRVGGRHLRQIVSNLLTNGIKFTASGGAVTLDVGVTDQRAIAIVVTDTGVGVSRSELQDLERRFAWARAGARGEKGYGLGLAIIRSILPVYNLSLEIDGKKGVGTTAKLTIPHSVRIANENEPAAI